MFLIFHILTAIPALLVGGVIYELIKLGHIRGEVSCWARLYVVLLTVVCVLFSQWIAYDLNISRGVSYGWQSVLGDGR